MITTIEDILALTEEWKDIWSQLQVICSDTVILLFGGGSTSELILRDFRSRNIFPAAFVDNSSNKIGQMINDLEIISLQDAIQQYPDAYYYITTQLYYSDIFRQLIANGIRRDCIIQHDLICQFQWEETYKLFIRQNQAALTSLIDSLEDAKSRQCVLNRLAFLISRRREFAVGMRGKIQYFEEEFIDYKKLKLFVDTGAYTGDTVLEGTKHFEPSKCKVIAFEMDGELYQEAEKNLNHLGDNVQLMQMAVSDADGAIAVSAKTGSGMRSITDDIFKGETVIKDSLNFRTCKLDTVLLSQTGNWKGQEIFLKMDIEGAEMAALTGAEGFIKTCHPVIAVCIYHKADDLLQIPQFIKKCYQGYRFRVRHYSDNQTKTVLYAIPDLLYMHRRETSIDNEVKNFAWPVTAISKEDYNAIMGCVNEHKNLFADKTILIFGAGIRGAEIATILESEGYHNILFTDNNSEKWGGVIDKYPIISVKEALVQKENVVYLVSVEEDKSICKQLLKSGLKRGIDFFSPKSDLYQKFIEEFKRNMQNKILVMGDCMFEVIAFDDVQKDSLTEIMQKKLGHENVKHLTMHGMGLPTFYHMLKAQLNNNMKPYIFVVMLNFETLTGKQHLLPRSQHTELVKKVVSISNDPDGELMEYVKIVDERVKNVQAEFFTTNNYSSSKLSNNDKGRISDNAAKVFFKLNYMYKLNPNIESIMYLKKIMDLANKNNFKVLPFVPPVNYERGIELFGERFEPAYNYNLKLLDDIISKQGFSLLDLSHICTKELFAHTTTPDETTNYFGRKKVAAYLCDEISRMGDFKIEKGN